jgi:polygalacturonase
MMEKVDLHSFGGKADGIFDNSSVFTAALEKIKEAGGGTLRIGPGVWRTGPLEIFSNTIIELDDDAVISFIPEPERYSPVASRWEGVECYAMHPCVFSTGQKNITITGRGKIEGNGQVWWQMLQDKRAAGQTKPETAIECKLAELNSDYRFQPGGGGGRNMQFLRPPLIQFFNCSHVKFEKFTLSNSPFWTVHPVYCDDLTISAIHIINPHDAPNTDGIDIDSCTNVTIEHCKVDVGDDGIALKSGSGPDGIRVNKPTRNVKVRDCVVGAGHGGIVIGSETAAGIFNVTAENCFFNKTDRGIRIKTRRGRGGTIKNLVFRNLKMEGTLCPLAINMYYRCGASIDDKELFDTDAQPINSETPSIKNIEISDITAVNCRASAGFIVGLPESPIENIKITNCVFTTDEQSAVSPDESDMFLGIPSVEIKSFRVLNTKNIEFKNVEVKGPLIPFLYL